MKLEFKNGSIIEGIESKRTKKGTRGKQSSFILYDENEEEMGYMERYLYESHTGGFYVHDEYLEMDFLHCETCGDSDTCMGFFRNETELRSLFEGLDVLYEEGCIEEVINEIINGEM